MQLRISKYDPAMRNSKGIYINSSDWISIGDVGSKVDLATYMDVENSYVSAIDEILTKEKIQELFLSELEDNRKILPDTHFIGAPNQLKEMRLKNKMRLDRGQVLNLIRLALRELVWFKIEGRNGEFIHSGYDMYMYLGLPQFKGQGLPFKHNSIYIEEFASPYSG